MSKFCQIALLVAIIFLGFYLRTYRISGALADWHSWRQADTSAVARKYVQNGINLLLPKYDDISNIPSGLANPLGYRMVEFPIFGAMHAGVYQLSGQTNFEFVGRLLSVFFSTLSILFLFLIVRKVSGFYTAILAGFFYAVLPFNIFYGRVILPEPLMICSSLLSAYLFQKTVDWYKEKIKFFSGFLLSLFFLSLSLLLKPVALFLIVPVCFYYVLKNSQKNKVKFLCLLAIYLVLGLIPFYLWRQWIGQFPEGIPASNWLLNGDRIRFKGAWFYWLFAERIAKLILGYWGIALVFLGLIAKTVKKDGWFYWLWLLSGVLYLVILATGNVKHDYYQILLIPVLCSLLARGTLLVINGAGTIFSSRFVCYPVLLITVIFMEAFGWYQIRDFFNINHPEIVLAGEKLDSLAAKDDKIIAPYGGDTAFLYQTKRMGWPIGGEIEKKITQGAAWYVTVNKDEEAKLLANICPVNFEEQNFLIIKLDSCQFP